MRTELSEPEYINFGGLLGLIWCIVDDFIGVTFKISKYQEITRYFHIDELFLNRKYILI